MKPKLIAPFTVARLRRSILYKPLAVMLAALLIPTFTWIESMAGLPLGPGAQGFQASAQVVVSGGCQPFQPNAIIQIACAGGVTYAPDLYQLESDAVNAYLGSHHLPASDAHVIYDLGRQDLRNAIRANMMAILLGIISKSPSLRTSHETNLYNWLQVVVKANEISLYTNAVAQYNAWQNDPCHFTLDPTVASTYGLSYDGASFCGTPLNSVFGGPPVPAESYFTAYGLKKSYGAPADQFPYFGSLVAGSAVDVGEVVGIATAASAVVTIGVGAALASSLTIALEAFVAIGAAGALSSGSGAFVVSGATVGAIGTGTLIAGPVAIILIAAAIGVTAGVQAFNSEATINNLNNLTATLTQVTNTDPDLAAFATDSSGLGMYKLQASLYGQTVPEVPSSAALPVHQAATDWNFVIGNMNTSTLTYLDWNQSTWSAQTSGGWFVQTCTSAGAKCAQADSIIASLRYVDWTGVNWTASRIDDKFVSTKSKPAPTDKPCPADAFAGVSLGPDFSNCTSYISTSIPLKDGTGNPVSVSLSPLVAPVFTSPATLPFTPGVASAQTITASGNAKPDICYSAGVLPSGFSLNGGGCGSGAFTVTFNGDPATPNGNYPLTLTASNGIAPNATQVLTLNVDQHLGITSPSLLTGTAGMPVNFLVTTTGNPPPKLSLGLDIPLLGLTFKDQGNGTATISGIATAGFSSLGCGGIVVGPDGNETPTPPCGITASNSQGTVTQSFGISMAAPPNAVLGPPTQATFTAGLSNSIDLTFTGAITPVTWNFQAPDNAPWLSLVSGPNGKATLIGTPPIGTSGTFTCSLTPFAAGTISVNHTFAVNVVTTPVISSPNTASFTVGTADSFAISANAGTIGLAGTLPEGLTFTGGSSASIAGAPGMGTGGQYAVTLTDDAGSFGSATQSLLLDVFEAPKITSPNSATLFTGMPGSFAVTTIGFPSVSTQPVPENLLPPNDPNQGTGMYFTVTGLPSTLRFNNLNPQGFATGTLTIEGTPSAADIGVHNVQITAQNGVGVMSQQMLTLDIVAITGAAPTSGKTCNGNYNGTFKGTVTVSAGQNCSFVGGGIAGNLAMKGGHFTIANGTITGNVQIQGASAFSFGPGTQVKGNLAIDLVASGTAMNQICGTTVLRNVEVIANATRLNFGSASPDSCPGNTVGGNLAVGLNIAPIAVYNNTVGKNLSCSLDASITGAGNTAERKQGQCSAF